MLEKDQENINQEGQTEGEKKLATVPIDDKADIDKMDDVAEDGTKKTPRKGGSNAKVIIKDILIACAIAAVISLFIKPTIVRETSMEPTLEPSDYVLISRQAYRIGDIKRGDIIVFQSDIKLDETHDKLLIKRVIGLPGDIITIANNKVFVNGAEIEEPYLAEGGTEGNMYNTKVPEGKLFVMGDHRTVSVDSRAIGFIDEDTVVGKAFFRLYPFSKIGTV